jgi:hypothetical protein
MDRPPEHAFHAVIQILPKPFFQSVLARTVRRKIDVPKLSVTAPNAYEASHILREHLRAELNGLKQDILEYASAGDQQRLWDVLVLLADVAPAEGLRAVLHEIEARER